MKKYNDAQLMVVRLKKNNIITSSLGVSSDTYSSDVYAPGRDRAADFE